MAHTKSANLSLYIHDSFANIDSADVNYALSLSFNFLYKTPSKQKRLLANNYTLLDRLA